ncbi:hypothetical protein L202_07386 [Cryptococcus amylolentus CBS 6039]|uniref:ABC1 atypical kinase-like domain-containing protein n=1 Tax=Cryptococcus amylolentus CBS 6039 TaxID=1295533 RepID=A0A1E3HC04_9TREE|nr:hypothetical protein L202_07386 [Cryptococcus amylolentus CBS 6039]ODN73870.1 hypothetical protein L202_07386 [Cryptococcus amylolentus CBS 6039]
MLLRQPGVARRLCPRTLKPSCATRSASSSAPPPPAGEHLTGSAKLFAEADSEESLGTTDRDSLRHTQGPVWTGDESTSDAVLRMLVDANKPLRNPGGIKHNAADDKIKGWMKGLKLDARLGPGVELPPNPSHEEGEEKPHRTRLPPHLHRPWHSTYTGEKAAAEEPNIKYGAFIKSKRDGDSLTNLLELQLPPGADGKTRARVKEARRSGKAIGRLDNAREGALDYKLGLSGKGPLLVDLGEAENWDEGEGEEQAFMGNRQIKGASVLGAGRGGASGLRAWQGLVEDRIQRAKDAGFFNTTKGKGKPIALDPEASNPYIERGELFMNRIVKRQGALPPWIELLNHLDSSLSAFRSTLLTTYRTHLVRQVISSTSLHPLPPLHTIPERDDLWEQRELKFHQENVKQINDLTRRMNAQAPAPARRNLITLENELDKIRGEVIKTAVWEDIKKRAEESVNQPFSKQKTGFAPFFEGEGWKAFKNVTRPFATLASSGTPAASNSNAGGVSGSSREYVGDHGEPSGHGGARDPKPMRLAVMAGVGIGLIIYLRQRTVKADDLSSAPQPEKDTIVASSPAEPPLTVTYIVQEYIIEPIATLFRFFQLAALFLPVIILSPMLLLGETRKRRQMGRAIGEDEANWGAIWWYDLLVKQMERAGPSFIKLGQWAASRADLFPAELCEKMGKLHSNGKPHSFDYTKKMLEKAFGKGFKDIFEEFDENPIGCGAIAQVYKAKLEPQLFASARGGGGDSTEPLTTPSVAIKVIHPRARTTIRRDITIMSLFARFINIFPGMQWFSLPEEVTVFGDMMQSQLDLRVEVNNLDTFRENFKRRGRRVTFPTPIKLGQGGGEDRVGMRDVLVEEFEDALPLKYFLRNGGGPYDHKIANIGLDAFLEMLLLDNFTHGDLHPGNIMVRFYKPTTTDYLAPLLSHFGKGETAAPSQETVSSGEEIVHNLAAISRDPETWVSRLEDLHDQGYEPQLIFIDAGLVTTLDNTNRRNFLDLFQAVAGFDGYKVGKLMIERCRTPEFAVDEETFALKMQHIVLNVKSKTFSLAKIKISDILTDVLKAVRTHHVKMEGDFVNTVISILLLEGIGRQLDPEMDLFKSALPILRQLGKQMGTREAISATPTGNILAMIKLWVWVEARQVAGEVSTLDQWIKYDRLTPSI